MIIGNNLIKSNNIESSEPTEYTVQYIATRDGYRTSFYNETQTYIVLGNSSGNSSKAYYLFENLQIPSNAVITNAQLVLRARSDETNTISLSVFGINELNPTFLVNSTEADALVFTQASVDWVPTNWTRGTLYNTPNINIILQEMVNTGVLGVSSNIILQEMLNTGVLGVSSNIILSVADNNSAIDENRRVNSIEESYNAPNAAILDITYLA